MSMSLLAMLDRNILCEELNFKQKKETFHNCQKGIKTT